MAPKDPFLQEISLRLVDPTWVLLLIAGLQHATRVALEAERQLAAIRCGA